LPLSEKQGVGSSILPLGTMKIFIKNLMNFKKLIKKIYNGKYFLEGMGFHRTQIKDLKKLLNSDVNNIVEFGSGKSTEFLLTYRKIKNLNYHIYSFDHNPEYSFSQNQQESNFVLNFRPLIKFSETEFLLMFKNKKLSNKFNLVKKEKINDFKIENAFYKLDEKDLPSVVDFVILDGPNGNGRSIAFLHLYKKLKNGAVIFIDDVDHYDYLIKLEHLFNFEILKYSNNKKIHPLFSYAIIKIVSKK